jgi:transposase InsO family protein
MRFSQATGTYFLLDQALGERELRSRGLDQARSSCAAVSAWFAPTASRGCQYTSYRFGKRCWEPGVMPSMGSVGDAYDSAMAESFFATLGRELLNRRRFKSKAEAKMATSPRWRWRCPSDITQVRAVITSTRR